MTFQYDEIFKHVFSIRPAFFNYIGEFAKSLADTLKNAQHPENFEPQLSINIDKKVEC